MASASCPSMRAKPRGKPRDLAKGDAGDGTLPFHRHKRPSRNVDNPRSVTSVTFGFSEGAEGRSIRAGWEAQGAHSITAINPLKSVVLARARGLICVSG